MEWGLHLAVKLNSEALFQQTKAQHSSCNTDITAIRRYTVKAKLTRVEGKIFRNRSVKKNNCPLPGEKVWLPSLILTINLQFRALS